MIILTITAIFWIICMILAYGSYLAYFQRSYPDRAQRDYYTDIKTAAILCIYGPVALILYFFLLYRFRYGLMYRNPHK